jgi:hypothetical protein
MKESFSFLIFTDFIYPSFCTEGKDRKDLSNNEWKLWLNTDVLELGHKKLLTGGN